MGLAQAAAGLLREIRSAFMAPAPCAGCPGGHAEQDWTLSLGGQVYGFCSHCGSRPRLVRPARASATKE